MPKNLTNIEILLNNITSFLHNDIFLNSITHQHIECTLSFDYDLWNNGFSLHNCTTSNSDIVIKPISITFIELLNDIELFLCDQLSNLNSKNFAYKSQIDRFLSMISNLKSKILAIRCITPSSEGSNIISHLLYILIQTIQLLTTILETINGLLSYGITCNYNYVTILDFLMGKLINNISDFQVLLNDWYSIVMSYLHYSSLSIKSYVASYVPKQVIPPPSSPHLSPTYAPCPPNPRHTNSNSHYNHPY